MGIFKLAWASFKRKKSSGIVFLVMCTIAALILSTALSLMIGTKGFYDKKVNELNAPHFSSFFYETAYQQAHLDFAKEYNGVTEISTFDALFCIGNWQMKGGAKKETSVILISEQGVKASFYSTPVIDKQPTKTEGVNWATLPLNFKTAGFKSGQQIKMTVKNKIETFTIYGFYEDAIAGSSTFTVDMVLIDDVRLAVLANEAGYIRSKTVMMRFEKPRSSQKFYSDFVREFNFGDKDIVFFAHYEESEMAASMFTNMMSMIMMIFAVIILIIAFIVVMFSIKSSITEEIKSIGVLKSIGYDNRKLRLAQITKYICIAAVGAVIGGIGSIFFFMLIGNIIASTSGLLWLGGTNFLPSILSIAIITALTFLISWLFTRKYKKITPVNALRNSSSAKVRGGNILPLAATTLPLDTQMGVKRFIASLGSNIGLFIVISLLVFISILVNVMNYNLNIDRTAMIEMVGLEMSEVWVQVDPTANVDLIQRAADIESDTRVASTILTGGSAAFVGEDQITIEVTDYKKLKMNTIINGRYPEAVGEIVLSAQNSKTFNKKVGSTLEVEINRHTEMYKVVGISQSIANGNSKITIDAMHEHDPSFAYNMLYVYLKPGTDTKEFMNGLTNSVYGEGLDMMSTEEAMDTILSSLGDPVQLLTGIMMVLNVIIVAFVLYLMISTIIRKTKQEFGILKALGFTNRRLVLQLLLSLLPALVIGTLLGTLLGFVLTNPILTLFFGSIGLLKTYFIIPTLTTILIAFCIFGTGVIATYLISLKLKKISPQKLITE